MYLKFYSEIFWIEQKEENKVLVRYPLRKCGQNTTIISIANLPFKLKHRTLIKSSHW